jgi:broad specificity phosphatase PhoE
MGKIHLIRHGQASFGADNYDQLSDLGFEQSHATGEFYRESADIDAIFRGSMRRHRETAEAMAQAAQIDGVSIEVRHAFDEFDHMDILTRYEPDWSNQARMASDLSKRGPTPRKAFQLAFREALARWSGGEFDDEYREPWPDFVSRCNTGIRSLADELGRGKEVAVVTSGGPISVIIADLLQLDRRTMLGLNEQLVNAGTTTLLYSEDRISIASLNESAYLRSKSASLITHR